MPTGVGDLVGFAPAIIETVNRYMKSPSADLLEFVFPPVRAVRRGLHLLQQILIASALRRVLGEWPWDIADLREVRCAKFGRARLQAAGREGNRRFLRWHSCPLHHHPRQSDGIRPCA